jgi:hypothetical protein
MKTFGTKDYTRLACLKKLQYAARQLGSDVSAVYYIRNTEQGTHDGFKQLAQLLENNLPRKPTETMKLYIKLNEFKASTSYILIGGGTKL